MVNEAHLRSFRRGGSKGFLGRCLFFLSTSPCILHVHTLYIYGRNAIIMDEICMTKPFTAKLSHQ